MLESALPFMPLASVQRPPILILGLALRNNRLQSEIRGLSMGTPVPHFADWSEPSIRDRDPAAV